VYSPTDEKGLRPSCYAAAIGGHLSEDINNNEPKWKRFERLVFEIQKGMTGSARVLLNDSIVGEDSKVARQIDISIRQQIGQYSILVVIDCKDHADPIDVKGVEEFAGLAHDVRANKGAIISSNGFTEAAKTVAKNHGIDTFRLLDTEGVDWKTYVTIPMLLERSYIKNLGAGFTSTGHFRLPSSMEALMNLELRSEEGIRLGTVRDVVRSKWDKQEIPHEAGQHQVAVGTKLSVEFEGVISKVDVFATVVVGRKYYLGPLPIHVKGFEDAQTGAIMTKEIRTDWIEPSKIEAGEAPGWTEITNQDELSIEVMLRLGYSDLYAE
jgi:Restriction endonuclease